MTAKLCTVCKHPVAAHDEEGDCNLCQDGDCFKTALPVVE